MKKETYIVLKTNVLKLRVTEHAISKLMQSMYTWCYIDSKQFLMFGSSEFKQEVVLGYCYVALLYLLYLYINFTTNFDYSLVIVVSTWNMYPGTHWNMAKIGHRSAFALVCEYVQHLMV